MRVLFDHSSPFVLAHGGLQIQIERTKAALESLGVTVEYLRWWDESQTGDLIHYFGAASSTYLELARKRQLPVVMTNLFSATCNRSEAALRFQGAIVRALLAIPVARGIKRQLSWRSFSLCDCNIVGIQAEQRVLEIVYDIPQERIAIAPLGLDEVFFEPSPRHRSAERLICVGTITECKNSVSLAQLARKAQVPLLFVGKPYSDQDPYWLKFRQLIDGTFACHHSHVDSPAAIAGLLRQSRGAVIMSHYENWCLAAHEAAACGLPVLLPPKNWARERFGSQATYFTGNLPRDAGILKKFYEESPQLPSPKIQLYRWSDTALALRNVYERLLSTSR